MGVLFWKYKLGLLVLRVVGASKFDIGPRWGVFGLDLLSYALWSCFVYILLIVQILVSSFSIFVDRNQKKVPTHYVLKLPVDVISGGGLVANLY